MAPKAGFGQREYVAKVTCIESLAWIEEQERPAPSPKMTEVGDLYFKHAKVTANWYAKSKVY